MNKFQKKMKCLGKMRSVRQLEYACTAAGPDIVRALILCRVLPQSHLPSLLAEIKKHLNVFDSITRNSVSPKQIHYWMWAMNLPQWYDAICSDLKYCEEYVGYTILPYSSVERYFRNIMGEVTSYIARNANSKRGIRSFTTAQVVQLLKLGEHE